MTVSKDINFSDTTIPYWLLQLWTQPLIDWFSFWTTTNNRMNLQSLFHRMELQTMMSWRFLESFCVRFYNCGHQPVTVMLWHSSMQNTDVYSSKKQPDFMSVLCVCLNLLKQLLCFQMSKKKALGLGICKKLLCYFTEGAVSHSVYTINSSSSLVTK